MPKPRKEIIAKCPSCRKPVFEGHSYPWCIECGERFPPEFQTKILNLQGIQPIPSQAQPHDERMPLLPMSQSAKTPAIGHAQNEAVWGDRIVKRYVDAYSIASGIDSHGQSLKLLATVLAILIGCFTVGLASQMEGKMILGVFITGAIGASVVWSIIYGHGVRIAAEGQHLLASLDIAIHTSPFMSDTQRARAMSL